MGMTMGRLRAKIRKLHELHEEEEMENGELNLVPYLDIVTNVIMFLMMTTTFAAALADINVSAPTVSRGGASESTEQPKQDLNLTVQISDKGFTVAASGAVLYQDNIAGKVPTIPKKGNDYDYAALTKKMKEIKDNFQDETKVIINANPEITYEFVVATMDAIRNEGPRILFPDVLLSAGVN
jgi:biopolymer transport protein TolR